MYVPKCVEIYKQDPDSLSKFQNGTVTALLNNIDNNNPKEELNINYNILHNTVQHFNLEHYNKHKHKTSSCITHGSIYSKQFRDKLHKIHQMTESTSEEHEAQSINLKTYNNILKQFILMAKTTYYDQIFNNMKTDVTTINGILNKTK